MSSAVHRGPSARNLVSFRSPSSDSLGGSRFPSQGFGPYPLPQIIDSNAQILCSSFAEYSAFLTHTGDEVLNREVQSAVIRTIRTALPMDVIFSKDKDAHETVLSISHVKP